MMMKKAALVVALGAVSALGLAGCSQAPAADTSQEQTAEAKQSAGITVNDAWVKAADDGMTAAFGSFANTGSTEATIVSVTATDITDELQLHETVADDSGAMVMRQVEGGFAIAAGESRLLEPGGDHIMVMSLKKALRAGDEVEFTVTMADESTFTFTAPVKDYSGANETYEDDSHDGHDGHDDHSDSGH